MNETDIKLLESDFFLGENLTPYKSQATLVAYTDYPDISFIIKEIDQPRSAIYDKLTGIWNPFIANTYDCNSGVRYSKNVFINALITPINTLSKNQGF